MLQIIGILWLKHINAGKIFDTVKKFHSTKIEYNSIIKKIKKILRDMRFIVEKIVPLK